MRALVITALALLVGCDESKATSTDASSTAASTAAPTTTLPRTTTVAPTTTVNPLFALRDDYLAMDTAWTTASDTLNDSYIDDSFGGVPWERQPNWCSEQAVIDEAFAAGITAYSWPPELQAKADEMSLALTVRAGVFHECSGLPGSFIGQSPIFDRQDDAYEGLFNARIKLRTALGLSAE